MVDLGRTEIFRVDFYKHPACSAVNSLLVETLALPFEFDACTGKCQCGKFAHGVVLSGGYYKVVVLGLLHDEPHALHIVFCVAPVAVGVEVAEVELVLKPVDDACGGNCDFACHESFATALALMVEENAVDGKHTIALAVVLRNPEAVDFGAGIGAAWIKRSILVLGHFLHFPIKLRCACLIHLGCLFAVQNAHSLKQSQCAHSIGFGSVFGHVEGDFHMALCGKIIYFVGLDLLDYTDKRTGVGHITIVKVDEAFLLHVAHPLVKV